jgi:NADPH-dependent glutamate synthase beta subunit-like oxidoreductase
MDAARTAVRLGAVATVFYRRTRAESEVHEAELEETLREGVTIQYLVSPLALLDDRTGRVGGVQLVRNRLGEPDASGRPRPMAIAGTEFSVNADTVILALGQGPDPAGIDSRLSRGPQRGGGLDHLETEVAGVFVAGDFATGPSTIIEAAAHGRRAAARIHQHLHTTHAPETVWPGIGEAIELELSEREPPLPVQKAAGAFSLAVEVEETFSRAEATAEALRCLHCGLPPTVTFDLCTACRACEIVCPVDCIRRVVTDGGVSRPSESFKDVAVYEIEQDKCIRCGRCFGACPTGAIVVAGFSWC